MTDLKKYKDSVIFVPLGGAKEIGMNLNLYQFGGKWIAIDMGIGFANNIPGIDVVVPDPNFLEQVSKDLLGIVITHAHEDHLGAVQYLWDRVEKPIYTSKFSAAFLKEKLKEYKLDTKIKIHELEIRKPFNVGDFNLEFFPISHSVPEMNAVIIKAGDTKIMHTGDWKFDANPVIGEPDNFKEIKKIGEQGIDVLVGDSTNVFNSGHSGSEGDLQDSLIKLIKQQNNLVVVATFASNLGRVISLIKAAEESSRHVVVCGRALERIIKIGVDLGYIQDTRIIIDRSQVKKHPRNKLLILATGCQGEERAAIRRLANDQYPNVKIQKNDTIIFSSKIIPGNELKISEMLNLFAKKQVKIITEKDEFVHVSGHPSKQELKKMYDLIKPKTLIPVHGEIMHINEHARFAEEIGIANVLRVTNGSCVLLDRKKPQIIGNVPSGYFGVDGNSLINLESSIIKQRRNISENGIVMVHVRLKRNNELLADPELRMPGLFDIKEDADVIYYLQEMLGKKIRGSIRASSKSKKPPAKGKKPGTDKINEKAVTKEIESLLKNLLKESIAKTPLIEVFISYA